MLAVKNEPLEEDFASFAPAQAELDYWERLNFSFSMDNDHRHQSGGESSRGPQRSPPARQSSVPSPGSNDPSDSSGHHIQDPALLAQFSALAGFPPQPGGSHESYESLAQALRTLQGSYPYMPPAPPPPDLSLNYDPQDQIQLPSAPRPTFPWPLEMPIQPSHQNMYGSHQQLTPYNLDAIPHPYGGTLATPMDTGANLSTHPQGLPSVASTSGSASPPEAQTEAELVASAEDKRRRNTAASARFRIKKKQRTLNLERSVSDLAGRAEELEKEAAELRRENGWLKEIVMLKGRSLGAGSSEIRRAQAEGGSGKDQDSSEDGSEDSDSASEAGKTKTKGKEKQKTGRKDKSKK